MKYLIGVLLFAFSLSANAATCKNLAYVAIAADVITTTGAIESGRGREGNPIYPKGDFFYPALLAGAALRVWVVNKVSAPYIPVEMEYNDNGKLVTIYGLKPAPDWHVCMIAGVTMAAAGNNAAIWADRGSERWTWAAGGAVVVPIIRFSFGR